MKNRFEIHRIILWEETSVHLIVREGKTGFRIHLPSAEYYATITARRFLPYILRDGIG